MRELSAIAAFRKVAETRNFSSAAKELHISPSAVSRQIKHLEENLGAQLVVRTTHHLRLTKIGEQLYKSCAKGLIEIERAVQEILQTQEEPQGTLRIKAAPFFARMHLISAAFEFMKLHPRITIDVSLHELETNFLESGVDILIQARRIRGHNIVHEDLAPIRHVICATSGYLKRHGIPRLPKDLMQHNCLLSTRSSPNEWPFMRNGCREYVAVSGNFRTDSVEILYNAVLQGEGIARLPNYIVGPELRSGKLVSLFPLEDMRTLAKVQYETTTNTLKAYYIKSRYPDPKTKSFIQFLKSRFKQNYNWEIGTT